jgi:hypothetical protein
MLTSSEARAPSDPIVEPPATSTLGARAVAVPPAEGGREASPVVAALARRLAAKPGTSALTPAVAATAGTLVGGETATWADAVGAKTPRRQKATIALRLLHISDGPAALQVTTNHAAVSCACTPDVHSIEGGPGTGLRSSSIE